MISKELDYLKNPSLDFKKKIVLGSYESLAMLEGKTRKCLFFYGSIWYNKSVI